MKPATAKAKGRATENQAVEWLRANGYPNAERRRLNGSNDLGDITGCGPGICIEVKSAAAWHPGRWLRELRTDMTNAHAAIGFVMARPKGGTNVDAWAFIVHGETLLSLLADAGWQAPNHNTTIKTKEVTK